VEAFPRSRLWCDEVDRTCILVGGRRAWSFRASLVPLDLDLQGVAARVRLDEGPLAALARRGEIVTDDNQLLAYGVDRLMKYRWSGPIGGSGLADANEALLDEAVAGTGRAGR